MRGMWLCRLATPSRGAIQGSASCSGGAHVSSATGGVPWVRLRSISAGDEAGLHLSVREARILIGLQASFDIPQRKSSSAHRSMQRLCFFGPRAFSASSPAADLVEGVITMIEQTLKLIDIRRATPTTKCCLAQEMFGLVFVPSQ
jgi:hypothetical protein